MKEPVHSVARHRFTVSAGQVFDAWLDLDFIGRSIFGISGDECIMRLPLEPKVGEPFSFVVDRQGRDVVHVGKFLEIERPQLLVFMWTVRDRPADRSRVIVEIVPLNQGCEVELTQVTDSDWAVVNEQPAVSWTNVLSALDRTFAPPEAVEAVATANFSQS